MLTSYLRNLNACLNIGLQWEDDTQPLSAVDEEYLMMTIMMMVMVVIIE